MVVQCVKDVTIDCIGKDLGNGFDKDTHDGIEVTVEPAVYSEPDLDSFQANPDDDKLVRVGEGDPIFIGQDALDSGFPIKSALGESDINRYSSKEYKDLLYGSMAKKIKANADIKMLVLGLPNKHYKKKHQELKEMVIGRKIVTVGNIEYCLNIKNADVIPQPMGTFFYLYAQGEDLEGEVLIADGGYGTFDATVVNNGKVTEWSGNNNGLKESYKKIAKLLEEKFEGKTFKINNIPHVLKNGFRSGGMWINPLEDVPEVKRILDEHFEEIYNFLIDEYRNLNRFDYVIWTGGAAQAHKDRIEKINKRNNFYILTDGQTANSKGYHDWGMGLLGE